MSGTSVYNPARWICAHCGEPITGKQAGTIEGSGRYHYRGSDCARDDAPEVRDYIHGPLRTPRRTPAPAAAVSGESDPATGILRGYLDEMKGEDDA